MREPDDVFLKRMRAEMSLAPSVRPDDINRLLSLAERGANAAEVLFISTNFCQCEHPIIKCDRLGCRCQTCGKDAP